MKPSLALAHPFRRFPAEIQSGINLMGADSAKIPGSHQVRLIPNQYSSATNPNTV